MAISRRAILLVGGAAVVVAGAGWALTREPAKAREPWRRAGESLGDPRLDALAYAILAPNPHNMQPWRARLDGDDAITIFCNLDRLLPETDPPNRQITIGFGCFIELLRQAAAEKGFRAEMEYFPEGEPQPVLDTRPIAAVRFVKDETARDMLFGSALTRRTNRTPFDERIPSAGALDAVIAASVPGVSAGATSDTERVGELIALTSDAWTAEWSTARTRRESINVTRIGKNEINNSPWGLALSGAVIEAVATAGVLTRAKMDEPGSPGYQQSLDFYLKACRSAKGFLWSTTVENARRDQLEAGRSWVRMHLAATAAGLALHPLSQALQEFPEMAPHYARAHALLAPDGGTVQMLGRLGYAKEVPPAPREPLEAHLIAA